MASTTNTCGMEFEVFLSFRGPDTRDNFTSCLYHDMVEKGIRVFKDDEELRVGQKIGGNLLRALDESQIYIPIFSKGFASSPWCLREVAHMVDCISKSNGKKEILPVFFDVEPDVVKVKKGLYRDALSEHENKYSSREVKRWRDALVEVPTRVGWTLEGKGNGELIKLIVREVLLKLKVKNRSLPDNLIETDDLKHIEELLKVDSTNHVRFVIIHGTGGIGKTTLASVIFNRIQSEFDCSSFLEDVQDSSRCHGLLDMQKKLLSDTLGSTSAQEIYDTNDGINRIRRGLGKKKVLIVLDNVDKKKQLEKLAGSCNWFGLGSRIIVTVRDMSIVLAKDNQTRPSNYLAYPVNELCRDQAIQLFSKHAFRSNAPPENCYNFSAEVVSSIGRLPLTLEVLGSLFAHTVRSEWDQTLKDLKQVPHRDIREKLMISINKLDPKEKAIFLDIACFCIGEDKTSAYYMWDDCKHSSCSVIDVLLLMSLVKIDEEDDTFWMHNEVRDLGRYIAKEENFKGSGKCPWVWIDEDTLDILGSNKEKPIVQALSVGIRHVFKPEELACFPMLRFLKGKGMNFVGDFKNCLRSLRWLSWHCCPQFLPATNLHLVNLVVLNLSDSKITHKWAGWRQIKMVKKLKVLDLTRCEELTKTPNFSEFGQLEKLILAWCAKLSKIDSSIGKLKLLSTLDLNGCESLRGLPEEIGSLEHLSEIIMPSDGKLFKLPETLGNLKSLTKFDTQFHPGIIQLPHSIGRMNLTHLVLAFCKNLYELPDSIGDLESLIELNLVFSGISVLPHSIGRLKNLKHLLLYKCENLHKLPNSIGELESLVKLDLKFSGIFVLPNSIGKLKNLKHLLLHKCKNLHELPDSIGELESLVNLDLKRLRISVLPNSIGKLTNLKHLCLPECKNLHELPNYIQKLESLVKLDLSFIEIFVLPRFIGRLTSFTHLSFVGCMNLQELPEFIGEMESLVELNLKSSGVSFLPDSIGNLKRLKVLNVAYTKIHTIPFALGGVKTLEELNASFCPYLLDDIPWEMWSLTRLWILNLDGSPISMVPEKISDFSSLQMLKLASNRLSPLPELPSSLKCLVVAAAPFPDLPDLSNLVHLDHLEVCGRNEFTVFRGRNNVSSRSLSTLTPQLPDFSNFKSLSVLSISGCPMPYFPVLKYLERLRELTIRACEFLKSSPDLTCLKSLQRLELGGLPKLVEVPGLGEVESLKFLHITKCKMISQLPNLWKLKNLECLRLEHSGFLSAVRGLEELNFLKCPVPDLPNLSNLVHLDHLEVCGRNAFTVFRGRNNVISRSLSTLTPQLPDFSNFKSLSVLSISGCPMPYFPVLKYLEGLRELTIRACEFLKSSPDLTCLKSVQRLELGGLPKLVEVPGLGEVESLKFLSITTCNMISRLPNLWKLKNLECLKLEHCGFLSAVRGLKELNFLEKVEIRYCMSLRLPDVPASTKLEISRMPAEAATRHSVYSAAWGVELISRMQNASS